MNANKKQEKLSTTILSYLRKNPDAGDTLEGIMRWWLEFERVDQSADEVAEALDSLLEKGLLKKVKYNGISVYKLNKQG